MRPGWDRIDPGPLRTSRSTAHGAQVVWSLDYMGRATVTGLNRPKVQWVQWLDSVNLSLVDLLYLLGLTNVQVVDRLLYRLQHVYNTAPRCNVVVHNITAIRRMLSLWDMVSQCESLMLGTKEWILLTTQAFNDCIMYVRGLAIQMSTRTWANIQRDGRPAKHRWRPLFNAAKFGWCPLLDAVQ